MTSPSLRSTPGRSPRFGPVRGEPRLRDRELSSTPRSAPAKRVERRGDQGTGALTQRRIAIEEGDPQIEPRLCSQRGILLWMDVVNRECTLEQLDRTRGIAQQMRRSTHPAQRQRSPRVVLVHQASEHLMGLCIACVGRLDLALDKVDLRNVAQLDRVPWMVAFLGPDRQPVSVERSRLGKAAEFEECGTDIVVLLGDRRSSCAQTLRDSECGL